MVQQEEDWRIGKGLAKLKKIDESLAEDRECFDRVQLMIKTEVTSVNQDMSESVKKARGIQFTVNEASAYGCATEYAAFSHALHETSKEPFNYGGVEFLIVYSAKMNHNDIGDFATESERLRSRYHDSVIDERDGKNWDANIQREHREAQVRVYEQLSKRLSDHAGRGISVSGTYRCLDGHRITYRVDGTVKSGHPDTSSGNGALNREVSPQAIAKLPKELRPVFVRGLVMGDDYLAWLYFDHPVDRVELMRALNDAEASLGIHPERGIFNDLRCASFISLGFYQTTERTYVALPKIGRLLSRLFWTVTPLDGRDPRRLAAGIAESFYPLYSTCPPMRRFLKWHMRVPPLGAIDVMYNFREVGVRKLPAPIDWQANHLAKYGTMGLLLDEVSMEFPSECGIAHHPVVSHIFSVDSADPADRIGCVTRS